MALGAEGTVGWLPAKLWAGGGQANSGYLPQQKKEGMQAFSGQLRILPVSRQVDTALLSGKCLGSRQLQDLPYFHVYNAHCSAQIFEGKIKMCIIHG